MLSTSPYPLGVSDSVHTSKNCKTISIFARVLHMSKRVGHVSVSDTCSTQIREIKRSVGAFELFILTKVKIIGCDMLHFLTLN